MLPVYMNVCVATMDENLFDVENSVSNQICRFEACNHGQISAESCVTELKKKMAAIQLINSTAKAFDWFISSILLVFVIYNFFEHIADKERKKLKQEQSYGSDNTLNLKADAEICNLRTPCGELTTRKNKFLLGDCKK